MSKSPPKLAPKKSAPRRATTRVTTRVVEQDDSADDVPEEEQEQEFIDPQEEALESFFSETRGHDGVEIRVYKLDPENRVGARAYATSVSLEDADSGRLMETLQRKWKGGEFELVARAEGRILKRTTVNILPPPEDDTKPPAIQAREEIAGILKSAMEPVQQMMLQMQQRPQFNFETLLTKGAMLMPLLQGIRQLIAPVPGGGAINTADPLAMLTQMKQLKETMDGLGMGDREPDGFDRIMSLFTQFKPMLEKMAVVQAQRAAHPRPTAPAMAGGPMPVSGAPVVHTPAPVVAVIPEALAAYVPMLAIAAQNGETVESVGERILSAIPDSLVDTLGDALDDGSLVSALLQKPEFSGATAWLNALAQYILKALDSGEEPEEETEDVLDTTDAPGDVDGDT